MSRDGWAPPAPLLSPQHEESDDGQFSDATTIDFASRTKGPAGHRVAGRPDRPHRGTRPLARRLRRTGCGRRSLLIGDFVWHDRNGSGRQDDFEEGVPGVKVSLLDVDEQPVDVDPVITDAQGEYRFDDLACGEYVVKFDTGSDGGSLTSAKAGDDRAVDSDPATRGDTHVGWTDPVVVTEDDNTDLTIDAGILAEYPECSIGDFIWSDENGNGLQDEGEPGIPNVTVEAAE